MGRIPTRVSRRCSVSVECIGHQVCRMETEEGGDGAVSPPSSMQAVWVRRGQDYRWLHTGQAWASPAASMDAVMLDCWTGSKMLVPPCARNVDGRNWNMP